MKFQDVDEDKFVYPYSERISIEEMRKIWNTKRTKYSDKDLLHIRDWLYTIAEVTINTINDYTKKGKLDELYGMLNETRKKRRSTKSTVKSTGIEPKEIDK